VEPGLDLRETIPQEVIDAALADDPEEQERRQEPCRVVVHNDDYTPAEFVTKVLAEVFKLGTVRATWVMVKAHTTGWATVDVLPRHVAEQRVQLATQRAESAGYPLRFTIEEPD
jgi:ATP-dependent Clp protease adaptor protein ClpS